MSDDDPDYNPQDHQACYLFNPQNVEGTSPRPTKKRRTAKTKAPAPVSELPGDRCLFISRFGEREEPQEAIQRRWYTFRRLWEDQEARINTILDSFNEKTLNDISTFVANAETAKYSGKLPTALVLAGPNIASHGPLFEQFRTRLRDRDGAGPVVVLTSKDATNLKGALKKLIRDSTEQDNDLDEDDEEVIGGRKGAKLLNYDLQILQNWCAVHGGKKVVIAVQDTEAFDSVILSDLIKLFSAYQDRIPFVLLLGIATSLDIFHEKLPKATIRLMEGEKFDVERAEECLAQVFDDAVLGRDNVLRIGPTLCDFLLDRQRDHTQSIQSFVAGLKYMYMSHFFGNVLSIILACKNLDDLKVLTSTHLTAVRILPSFKQLIELALDDRDTSEVRNLVSDDEYLRKRILDAIHECMEYGEQISCAVAAFETARNTLTSSNTAKITRSDLYTKTLRGDMHPESTLVRDLLLIVKKSNSATSLQLLDKLLATDCIGDSKIRERLKLLRDAIKGLVDESDKKKLTSEFDISENALRTTAISRRVQMSEHKASMTGKDSEYSKFILKLHDLLAGYFSKAFLPVKDLFLHEVFFYDSLRPHQDVFMPKQRAAVEEALANPSEYLRCECCVTDAESGHNVMNSSNPTSSIAYQLYLDGGALINAFDLWTAFHSGLQADPYADEDDDDSGEDSSEKIDEKTAQALYYRSIAELKFMGFIKPTRKRVDHLQKLAWKGL